MDCDEYIQRRVKLGYVADCGHCVQLVDSIGNQVFDMLPVIQAGETDTSLELITEAPARLRYNPEEYTRTEGQSGCFYDICISDIAALINLDDLGDVEAPDPSTGDTIIYNGETRMYELYNVVGEVARLDARIDAVNARCDSIENQIAIINNTLNDHNRRINQLNEQLAITNQRIAALTSRVAAIENAIYNWGSDKNTKIPRANINVTSGGYNGNNGIFCRAKNQDNDLDFQ